MADVPQIVFTDHDGNAVNLFTTNVRIQYMFEGLTVSHKNGLVGYTTDPIRQYRVVTCTAIMSGDNLNTLNGYLMDTAKAYDGTDPKIVVALDGDTSLTILCTVAGCDATMTPATTNQWTVNMTFEERST